MRISFSAKGLELTAELEKYANGKIAHLARRVPRKFRTMADCRVDFAQTTRKGSKFSTCTLKLSVDDVELEAKETTQHMYAALDIATVHVEQQLKDHARKQQAGTLRRHFRAS